LSLTITKAPAVLRSDRRRKHSGSTRVRRSLRDALTGYSFLVPNLTILGLFVFVPLGWVLMISLRQTNGFGDGVYVGLANYRRLLSDHLFWRATLNTAIFTALVVPCSMVLGLAIATLMNSVLPARGAFRTIIILPMVISGVATALIGVLIFDQNSGIANKLLRTVGLDSVPWQSSGTGAFASIVLVTLWWRVGFNMVVYLAGLQSVPTELYESAKIDGAGTWDRFRFVTIPMVRPSTSFLMIMNVIYSFQIFDIVFVLTEGGPGNSTTVLVTYAYNTGFLTRDQGYASAIGVLLLIVTMIFTAVQWRISRTREVVE
jgi:multiple sugar transport system permease protein